MRRIFFPADSDRMPRIGPATVAHHDIRFFRQEIDDLALALIPPLQADNAGVLRLIGDHGTKVGGGFGSVKVMWEEGLGYGV